MAKRKPPAPAPTCLPARYEIRGAGPLRRAQPSDASVGAVTAQGPPCTSADLLALLSGLPRPDDEYLDAVQALAGRQGVVDA